MWPFKRKASGGSISADGNQKKLEKQVEALHAQVLQLQQQLAAVGAFRGEYLYKMRSVALPIMGPDWELRYFVLQGTTIKYFKSHKDVIFSPREELSTLGCTVEWHGLQGARFWVWTLVDPGGTELLRLASQSEQTAIKWVSALEATGCKRQMQLGGSGRQLSMPTASLAAHGLAVASSTLSQLPGSPIGSLPRRPASIGGQASPLSPRTDAHPGSTLAGAARPAEQKEPATAAANAAAQVEPGTTMTPPLQDRGDSVGALHQPPAAAIQGAPRSPTWNHSRMSVEAEAAPTASAERDSSTPADSQDHHHQQQQQPSVQQAAHAAGARGPGGGGKQRRDQLPSSPVHTASKYSYLSSERVWHERHTGLYNLMAVILIVTNFRLALENALKYGWRYNPLGALKDLTIGNPNIPVALCYPALALLALMGLGSEQLGYQLMQRELQLESGLSKKGVAAKEVVRQVSACSRMHESLLFLLSALITSATIALPWAAINITQAEPMEGAILIGLAIVWWMKLVSFHHCCSDLRSARRAGEVRPGERGSTATPAEWALLAYPENLTIKNLLYFLAAPTLSYQVNYPRSTHIRWKWLARRVAELALMLTVLSLIVKQFMEPAIANSMKPLKQMNWVRVCERLLKLALPNTYCWLVMFYTLFHVWLNILAELLRFGDREFYKDWWNAPTLGEYWKLWNMPVHKWLLRHVYFPSLRLGLSRFPAMIIVFLVSAAFHELILGVPLHMVRLWAFTGIMLQVPMIVLTEYIRKKLNRDEAGNYVFWLTFCVVGQPLSILLYAHDYLYQVRPNLMTATNSTGYLPLVNETLIA